MLRSLVGSEMCIRDRFGSMFADNVVFFCPLSKVFKSKKMDSAIQSYGDIATVINMGGGGRHGFPFGFSTGCIHYKRDYNGPITYIREYD